MRVRRWRALVATTLFWTTLLVAVKHAHVAEFLESKVVRALEFRTREALGQGPRLDPRLKAFAYDDGAAGALGGGPLPASRLLPLLRAIATARPRVIIIDGMFSSDQALTDADRAAVPLLAGLAAPIAAGAMLTRSPISHRETLPDGPFANAWALAHDDAPLYAWPASGRVYGPTPLFQRAFRGIGHITQLWPTRFAPAVRLADGRVVPHLGLFAAETRLMNAAGLRLDGVQVPLDQDGLAFVNYLDPSRLGAGLHSMKGLLARVHDGTPLASIRPGDVVVLILNAFTGSTDFHDTPFGELPGGFVLLSIVNSVLRHAWLTSAGLEEPYIAAAAALGAAIGLLTSTFACPATLAGAALLQLLAALAAFAYGSTAVPWLFPLTGLGGAGLTTYAMQRYRESQRRLHLEVEMATASALQKHFFPPPLAEHAAYQLAAYYHPAEAVGGDWYAYEVYAERWLHLHVGDVTGHGASAALLASFAKGATDMIYEEHRRKGAPNVPLELLHDNLNQLLCRGGQDTFMTLWSMAIDLVTGDCFCLNSGHRPALLLRGGAAKPILARGASSILGYRALPAGLRATRLQLRGDETVLVLSDGLLDVPTSFGVKTREPQLRRLLAEVGAQTPSAARATILERLRLAAPGDRPFIDDVTFVVLRLRFANAVERAS